MKHAAIFSYLLGLLLDPSVTLAAVPSEKQVEAARLRTEIQRRVEKEEGPGKVGKYLPLHDSGDLRLYLKAVFCKVVTLHEQKYAKANLPKAMQKGVLYMEVWRSGKLKDVFVSTSFGSEELDQSVVLAAHAAAPFAPIPAQTTRIDLVATSARMHFGEENPSLDDECPRATSLTGHSSGTLRATELQR